MRFYTKQHKYYCGIELHTKKMYICIFDSTSPICLQKNTKTSRNDKSVHQAFSIFEPFPYSPRLLETWISPKHSFLDSELILYLLYVVLLFDEFIVIKFRFSLCTKNNICKKMKSHYRARYYTSFIKILAVKIRICRNIYI